MDTLDALVLERIGPIVDRLKTQSDDNLAALVLPQLEAGGAGELHAGTTVQRLLQWTKTTFRSACLAAGGKGKEAWEILQDHENRHNAERVALLSAFLLARLPGAGHWPLEVAVSAAMLLISLNSKKPEPPQPTPPST
jgi:hypothetical protein